MYAPKLYTVRKYNLMDLVNSDYNVSIQIDEESKFYIKEQDSQLFRQIRLITKDQSVYNKYIVFVDCSIGGNEKEAQLAVLINNGFEINNQTFVFCERSASMTRNATLSFVDQTIADSLYERVSMGICIDKTVLSKYYAYRGLMLSSCHCIAHWYPIFVIVPDCYRVIKNQNIKYLYDKEVTFVDEDGKEKTWLQKDIAEGVKDIEINAFDGCGIHHPEITRYVKAKLEIITAPTSIQWRLPFCKGMTHEVNYVEFFHDHGITEITDVWGEKHDVSDSAPPLIIMTESMYKGMKYFEKTGTYTDWEEYWHRFKQYNHCIGVAKWNVSLLDEPVYTRGNYQILQDLDLTYDAFAPLAKYTIDWAEKIIGGDRLSVYCSLGLFLNKCKPLNHYTKAILKNPEMLKERGVRDYLIQLWKKQFDDIKCGKIWIKGAFKFLAPDLIMLMQHIGELKTSGCLNEEEFHGRDFQGTITDERVIERNPHICHSEHVILNGTDNELIQTYCPNLVNVCMVNSKSIVMQKMNGADVDGDLVFVIDNAIIKAGINRHLPTVIDLDDKITSQKEADYSENRTKVTLRTMKNLIGEYSNYASAYHNKTPHSPEQKEKYNKYIEIISILTGKSIDYAKTGVLYTMPKYIAKYGHTLPWFMRYRSDYYKRRKLSRAKSNMNRLCWDIEKWEKQFRWKHKYKDFDYTMMIDYNCLPNENVFEQIEQIFLRYCSEMKQLRCDEIEISKEVKDFKLNWDYYHAKFRNECEQVCPDRKMLANAAVKLCYEKYPNKNYKFIWRVAGDGIVENLVQTDIRLPLQCNDGEYEYLGKKYKMTSLKNVDGIKQSGELECIENLEEM